MPATSSSYKLDYTDTTIELEPNTLIFEEEEQNHGYIILSKLILYADNLSKDAKILYAYLLGYAYEKDHCFPGYQTLCKDLGTSDNTVRKFMRELETAQLLRQHRRGLGKTNVYILLSLSKAKIQMQAHHEKSRTSKFEVQEHAETEVSEQENLRSNNKKIEEIKDLSNRTVDKRIRKDNDIFLTQQFNRKNKLDSKTQDAIDGLVTIIAHAFNDQAPIKSSLKRAYNTFSKAGVDLATFEHRVQEARDLTEARTAKIRKREPLEQVDAYTMRGGGKTKMAYWFRVLEDRLGVKNVAS